MKKISVNDLKFVGVVLGFLATIMIFFPALSTSGSSETYTGLQVVFGHEFIDLGGAGGSQIRFSFLNLLAFLLPTIASLTLLFMKKGQRVSSVIFGVSTVMLFLVAEFTVVTVTILSNVSEISVDWTYAYGLIIAAILSILGFLVSLYISTQKTT